MPLTITSRVENEIVILDLEGSLTLGPALHSVRETARQALTQNQVIAVVINLANVSSADSAGLGELTVVYRLASKKAAKVLLAGPSTMLRNMLEITRLDGLLPVVDDISAARKLLSASR